MSFAIDIWGIMIIAVFFLIGIFIGKLWGHKSEFTKSMRHQQKLQATQIWAQAMQSINPELKEVVEHEAS